MTKVNVRFNEHNVERDLTMQSQAFLADLMLGIRRHAQRLVPWRTGDLYRSIDVTPKLPASKMKVVAGMNYASFVEFGTYKQRPQPYMRPARDLALRYDVKSLNKKHGTNFKVKT